MNSIKYASFEKVNVGGSKGITPEMKKLLSYGMMDYTKSCCVNSTSKPYKASQCLTDKARK